MEFNDTTFALYAGLLMLSGVVMIVLAATGFGASSKGSRIINALLGLAFAGYGFYLFFLFEGGEFRVLWYVFVLPLIMIYQAIKYAFNKKKAAGPA